MPLHGFTENRNCEVCGKAYVAHHKKAMYCGDRVCIREGARRKKVLNAKLSFQYAFENHLLMKKMDYIIQMLALVTGIPTPFGLIPKKNQVDLSHYDKELEKLFEVEKKRIGRKLESLNKKPSIKKDYIPKLTDEILKEQEQIKRERLININHTELWSELKNISIETIKKNTGKFPILTPQEVIKISAIIERIVDILEKTTNGNIGNKEVIDYFTNAISDITSMPNEKYFN